MQGERLAPSVTPAREDAEIRRKKKKRLIKKGYNDKVSDRK